MSTEIKMPQLGETVVEGTITRWLKQEGDQVEEDELLVEISTDKVDSEVPSTTSGKLQKILVPEGETVKVGTPLAIIGEGDVEASGDGGGEAKAEAKSQEAPAEADKKQSVADQKSEPSAEGGSPTSPGGAVQPAAQAEAEPQSDNKNEPSAKGGSPTSPGGAVEPAAEEPKESPKEEETRGGVAASSERGRPGDTSKRGIISPLVRRLADENSVTLEDVEGTGTGGRIRKQDVMRFIEERKARPAARSTSSAEPAPERVPERQPQPQERPAAASGAREELVPWSNIRRRTAEHMVASHLETARAWNAVEADWTNIVALRTKVKDTFKQREGFSLTYMPFLAKIICETLMEMPEVNASYDEEHQGNLVKHYVNLGIAVALDGGGLIVPVVKGADEKNLVGLARGIYDVATRARSKKLTPDDLAGGTFTITNPGPFGSIISVPIIPRGQTAILGFEAIEKRVVVTKDDAIAVRSMGFLTMSWDHRIIDGAEAAKFLARLRERVETTDFTPELSQYE
jgi:2-oxoglutarate dehydrogenase E2 component (dihydrolipoamide succinyltransferase)